MDDVALTTEQVAAIGAGNGVVLVVAAAGSGKTEVITRRIARLVSSGQEPGSILALTFTRNAAEEMAERVRRMTGATVRCATFHAECLRFLKRWYPKWRVAHPTEILRLIRQASQVRSRPSGDCQPGALLARISYERSHGRDPTDWPGDDATDDAKTLCEIARAYERAKEEQKVWDFDDLLCVFYEEVDGFGDRAREVAQAYRWILVDEFQDTNPIQFEIAKCFARGSGNLFCVGDDWQSVYSFRGAAPEIMVDFASLIPSAKVLHLTVNFRSGKKIVDCANRLISYNTKRTEKTVIAARPSGVVELREFATDVDEADAIAADIEKRVGSSHSVAVLFRTRAQSCLLEDALARRGIPYEAPTAPFWQREETQPLIDYLRAALLDDVEAACRIANVPPRLLGPAFVTELRAEGKAWRTALARGLWSRAQWMGPARELGRVLDGLRRMDAAGDGTDKMLEFIRGSTGYDQWVATIDEDGDRLDNIDEAMRYARLTPDPAEFLRRVAQTPVASGSAGAECVSSVTLSTIHGAKGREWDTVYVAGFAEPRMPHRRGQIEEERRLAYTAITRARVRCVLCVPAMIRGRAAWRSRFEMEAVLGAVGAEAESGTQGGTDDE